MKKQIMLFGTIALFSINTLASCESSKANENNVIEEVKSDVAEMKNDVTDEVWEAYKKEIQQKIDANKDKIESLREAKRNAESRLSKDEYKAKIDELQERNQKLREKLADYPLHRTDWEEFKAEVNKEVGQIGQELNNL